MPLTVVVGGQFGSEGKGKIAHYLAREQEADIAVRVGGPNSGHTVVDEDGTSLVFQLLPTAALLPNVCCVLAAGSYIKLDVMMEELASTNISSERLVIDPNAMIITSEFEDCEHQLALGSRIGSTESGTGAAVLKRVARASKSYLASKVADLHEFVRPTVPLMRSALDKRARIIIEGTQGFGLSLLHSSHYPFVTSRDTSAAGFVSEVGLSPFDVDDVVMVLRSFPIRVGGHSGPLPREIDWDTVTKESGSTQPVIEYASVTRRLRRVARFDPAVILRAINVNRPSTLVLNHLDHVDAECRDATVLSQEAITFVEQVESSIDQPVDLFGTGPSLVVPRSVAIGEH